MTWFKLPIRARLMLFMAAFLTILTVLAAVVTTRLIAIDDTVEVLSDKAFPATQMLDELDNHVAEFRMAETYRALASDANQLVAAELLAKQHRKTIEYLLDDYLTVTGKSEAHVGPFRAAWNAYLAEHDAWVAADSDGRLDDPARYGSSLHRLYRSVMTAIDRLLYANKAEATREAREADELVDQTTILTVVLSGLGLVLAIWAFARIHRGVIQPLRAITAALLKLAAGNREVRVPELNRDDEIGQMAKAFDVFRANASALETAHQATRAAQEQAQALARHDALTGLPNRRVFTAELEAATARAQNGSSICSVLMIDLDRFKPVNDLQGHAVGDLVLCEVARRLQDAVRKNDVVARLGGDEFAIVTKSEPKAYPEGVIRLANRVLAAIREPILVADGRLGIDGSIGIASAPGDGVDSESLLRAADIAMYRAKRDGRGTFRFFEHSMDAELRAQAALEVDLRRAIAEGDIRPYYQPLVNIADTRIYGFEILARWQHAERGAVRPDVFIPLAEQFGLISDLTWSILRQACRDAKRWPEDIRLSLNISPLQLKDPALPTQMLTILNQEGFSPARLEVEITESALVGDIDTAKLILSALQAIGIKVSLDDFGTGYSSLHHLRELKFDKVKIDQSFVCSMQDNSESEKIVDAILGLATSLGMPTVAEGIENPTVLHHLADMGCKYGQGYYFGKAMTAENAAKLLVERSGMRKAG
jgi:diguanylate cyclase (GGDEF)-like protein